MTTVSLYCLVIGLLPCTAPLSRLHSLHVRLGEQAPNTAALTGVEARVRGGGGGCVGFQIACNTAAAIDSLQQ